MQRVCYLHLLVTSAKRRKRPVEAAGKGRRRCRSAKQQQQRRRRDRSSGGVGGHGGLFLSLVAVRRESGVARRYYRGVGSERVLQYPPRKTPAELCRRLQPLPGLL